MPEPVSSDNGRLLVFDGLVIANWSRDFWQQLHDADISAVHATAAVWEGTAATVNNIEWWQREFAENSDLIVPAVSSSEIRAAHQSHRTAVLLGFQNTDALEGHLDR